MGLKIFLNGKFVDKEDPFLIMDFFTGTVYLKEYARITGLYSGLMNIWTGFTQAPKP